MDRTPTGGIDIRMWMLYDGRGALRAAISRVWKGDIPHGKRPRARRRRTPGARHRVSEHARAVCERAVQHCGPHVHRPHCRCGRSRAGGRGRVRAGGHDDRLRRVARGRGRLPADEHQARRERSRGRARHSGQRVSAAVRLLRDDRRAGAAGASGDALALRRERCDAPLCRRLLLCLPAGHAVRAARDRAQLLRRCAGLCKKGHALRRTGRGAEHRARPGLHLPAGHGRSGRRGGHGGLAVGQLHLCAALSVRAPARRAHHLWRLCAAHHGAYPGAGLHAVLHHRRGQRHDHRDERRIAALWRPRAWRPAHHLRDHRAELHARGHDAAGRHQRRHADDPGLQLRCMPDAARADGAAAHLPAVRRLHGADVRASASAGSAVRWAVHDRSAAE